MPSEYIGDYLVEYTGEPLCIGKGWAAYLTIYAASPNPAHRTSILPKRRVCLDTVFLTQEAAAERARELAIAKIGKSAGSKRS